LIFISGMDSRGVPAAIQGFAEAFLMVEFCRKTNLPLDVGVYGESENTITMIGTEYVQIAKIEWTVRGQDDQNHNSVLQNFLLGQLARGVYNGCAFVFAGKKWTVKECIEHITGKK